MKTWVAALGYRALVGALILASAGGAVQYLRRVRAASQVPTAPARKGEFLVMVRCRGELKARSSVQVVAPVVPDLQIVWQATPGSAIREGEPVVRFDSSSAQRQLTEKEAALKQAQAALDQAVALARITAEQDRLDLAAARYQVERAKLEVSKLEIVSAMQGEESKIDLGLAERKLRVEEATVALHQASDKAKMASLARQRDQAQSEVDVWRRRLDRMELKAPSGGVVVYMPNYSQGWMNARPFKVGDRVWPSSVLAEIPDLATLEMEGKIEEIDRGRMVAGSAVKVRVDAFPEKPFDAKLASISPLTEQAWEWPPTRSFRGFAQIQAPDPRLRPGMNGGMDVVVDRLPAAISVPAKALFTRSGKPIVYVSEKGGYRAVEVEVLARNQDEVAVRGIGAGAMVATVEPEKAPS
ncbi:MAG: efflux RND transporter periplasmic adaptor subunit [Acidobacteria bacterium]|nr:efflux RND transporter periplasmic adaptor subunit [Acidobacteriota bacterium]